MDDITEESDHPFWGRILRLDGYEGWHHPRTERLPDGTSISIRFEFDDPDNIYVQENYAKINARWPEIWSRINIRIADLKKHHGYDNSSIRSETDWFELKLPDEPLDQSSEWNVMLQSDDAGWLIDFVGWNDGGGQGVF